MNNKIVGIYGDANLAATDPSYLDVLQQEIGLNAIIFGGGFNLSPEVRALNPVKNGKPGVAPGLSLVDDDAYLHKAIDEAHKRGMKVWACISSYWAGAEHAPELMAVDLYGNRMDHYPRRLYAHEQGTMTFCPSKAATNDWFEAALTEIAVKYDFQGYALTHFRYCHPAFFEQNLSCACPDCQNAAKARGYDFDRMKKAVLQTIEKIKQLTPDSIHRAGESGLGLMDFLQVLGTDGGAVIDWFNFRADIIMGNLERFKDSVKGALTREFAFGSDTHYPTMAMLVGHRYSDLARICDQILPLLSHNEIHFLDNLGSFATILMSWIPDAKEEDAVRVIYHLFGLDSADMPATVGGMNLGDPPNAEPKFLGLEKVITKEMKKARILSGGDIPSYPVIKGSIWDGKIVRNLIQASDEIGHHGIIFQGTDSLFSRK